MKQLNFTQTASQMGELKGVLRFKGKDLFFKCNNHDYSASMLTQMRVRGAVINEGRSWIRINMFGDKTGTVKIGEFIIDLDNDSDEEIEEKLLKFYAEQYAKAKFEVKEIK